MGSDPHLVRQLERSRVQCCGNERAVEELYLVVLCHSAQRAGRRRMVDRIYVVGFILGVGEKEGRFVSPELCKVSLGLVAMILLKSKGGGLRYAALNHRRPSPAPRSLGLGQIAP